MNSYFLCVTQPTNAGDLLINRMLVEELSLYGKVYVDCYNCPNDFRTILLGDSCNIIDVYKEYGISLKRLNLISFAKLIKQNKIVLYTQSPGPLDKPGKITVRFSLSLIRRLLSLLRIPFVRIGCCCSKALSKRINVAENNNVQYYVRSYKGVDYLKQYRSDGIFYIPDLAFLYKYKATITSKKKIAIISFREISDNFELFIQWLKECISILSSNNYEIVLYYQVKKDRDFMLKIADQLDPDNVVLKKEIVWYDDFDFYSDKTIVISNRLHCLLMGAIFNAIPYAYVDDNNLVRKIPDVFESSMGNDFRSFIGGVNDRLKLNVILEHINDYQSLLTQITNNNAYECRNTIKEIMYSLRK